MRSSRDEVRQITPRRSDLGGNALKRAVVHAHKVMAIHAPPTQESEKAPGSGHEPVRRSFHCGLRHGRVPLSFDAPARGGNCASRFDADQRPASSAPRQLVAKDQARFAAGSL
jgi:hypothetical protein